MLKVELGVGLEPGWRDVIKRELDLSLLRVEERRYTVTILLNQHTTNDGMRDGFLCGINIYDSGELISEFTIDHGDGRFAIRQALARTRRTLARREGLSATPAANRTASVVRLR